MLIKSPIAEKSVISFRLVTGETLLARFVRKDEKTLVITRPVVANPVQNEQGYGIFYSPFCATVDEDQDFSIPMSAILIEPMRPRAELEQSYIKMTTGLDIPIS